MKQRIPTYWFVIAGYLIITLLTVAAKAPNSFDVTTVLINRAIFLAILSIVLILKNKIDVHLFRIISLLVVYAFLSTVYKETALINTLFFSKQDALVSHWDELIFGTQPAIEFSKYWNSTLFSELMFGGYFSYYLMPLVVIFSLYKSEKINHFGFILITSFVIYYTIFNIFPVEGPQFYFPYPENHIEAQGIFGEIVKLIQDFGEAPTAAFPSSHIGITVVILLWLYNYQRKLLIYIVPFAGLLFFATVYIKAHYAVDALAGIASGWLIYIFVNLLYTKGIKED